MFDQFTPIRSGVFPSKFNISIQSSSVSDDVKTVRDYRNLLFKQTILLSQLEFLNLRKLELVVVAFLLSNLKNCTKLQSLD